MPRRHGEQVRRHPGVVLQARRRPASDYGIGLQRPQSAFSPRPARLAHRMDQASRLGPTAEFLVPRQSVAGRHYVAGVEEPPTHPPAATALYNTREIACAALHFLPNRRRGVPDQLDSVTRTRSGALYKAVSGIRGRGGTPPPVRGGAARHPLQVGRRRAAVTGVRPRTCWPARRRRRSARRT